ncbi:substrate-binding domain-containing protein [Isoptericola croceus]|uniref:substrate-binding domain-containing protein n=1 Tax=Isoptericola croceus TaxID=3031406 RepID=UPI0023F8DF49|nr:sugar-binding protein [Isoptericola croceus]
MNRRLAAGAAVVGAAAALVLSGCGADDGESSRDGVIGVAMPTESSERWISDGRTLAAGLEEAGYDVDLRYAGDDTAGFKQAEQVQQMIDGGAELLIIAAVDGAGLADQLEVAAARNIPVIAYDRLLLETDGVDHYVTFDNYKVGVAQATSLLRGLGVVNAGGEPTGDEGPYNVELFAGSLDDNNAHIFWEGAIDTLQPYLDDGVVEVPSGQTDIVQAETWRWSKDLAQDRMASLVAQYYADDTELDGVLSPYDGISRGIITALALDGEGPTIPEGMPVVTGQDAEVASVKLIREKMQYATVFKDTRALAEQAVVAALAYLEGGEPEVNDTDTYDNGVKAVPTFLLDVSTVYRGDIDEVLVESGYYSDDEIAAG